MRILNQINEVVDTFLDALKSDKSLKFVTIITLALLIFGVPLGILAGLAAVLLTARYAGVETALKVLEILKNLVIASIVIGCFYWAAFLGLLIGKKETE